MVAVLLLNVMVLLCVWVGISLPSPCMFFSLCMCVSFMVPLFAYVFPPLFCFVLLYEDNFHVCG